jgi:NurA-like 5'-3' nuclease
LSLKKSRGVLMVLQIQKRIMTTVKRGLKSERSTTSTIAVKGLLQVLLIHPHILKRDAIVKSVKRSINAIDMTVADMKEDVKEAEAAVATGARTDPLIVLIKIRGTVVTRIDTMTRMSA